MLFNKSSILCPDEHRPTVRHLQSGSRLCMRSFKRLNSVKRSDITGHPFETLLGENNVILIPLPHTPLY